MRVSIIQTLDLLSHSGQTQWTTQRLSSKPPATEPLRYLRHGVRLASPAWEAHSGLVRVWSNCKSAELPHLTLVVSLPCTVLLTRLHHFLVFHQIQSVVSLSQYLGSMIIRDLRGIESTQDACAKIRVGLMENGQNTYSKEPCVCKRHLVSLFYCRNLRIRERVQLSSCPLLTEGSSSLTQPQR